MNSTEIKNLINTRLLSKCQISKSGIYFIWCMNDEKIYIGSANKMTDRIYHHKKDLVDNNHDNSYLQNAWNKYGPISFVFGCLEQVENRKDLISKEQYWLDYIKSYKRDVGFNILKIASNSIGYKHTEENKRLMSRLKIGKTLGKEHKEKISHSLKNKFIGEKSWNTNLTDKIVKDIKLRLLTKDKMSYKSIASEFNTTESIVIHIARNERWSHIAPELVLPKIKVRNFISQNIKNLILEELRIDKNLNRKYLANKYNIKYSSLCQLCRKLKNKL